MKYFTLTVQVILLKCSTASPNHDKAEGKGTVCEQKKKEIYFGRLLTDGNLTILMEKQPLSLGDMSCILSKSMKRGWEWQGSYRNVAVKSGKRWRRMPQNEGVNQHTERAAIQRGQEIKLRKIDFYLNQTDISLRSQDTQL